MTSPKLLNYFKLGVFVYTTFMSIHSINKGEIDMDIVKHYTYFDFNGTRRIPVEKIRYYTESRNWVEWFSIITSKTCVYCASHHGHILSMDDSDIIWPPAHDNCRCQILPVPAFPSGTATEDGLNGVDYYLFTHHCLPDNYMTQEEAKLRGWKRWIGNLWDVLPGVIIGGDEYYNWDSRLPQRPGRKWYEVDIDYNGGFRNLRRIIFSNDGLMFVTYDHYLTFSEVYWEDNDDDLYN